MSIINSSSSSFNNCCKILENGTIVPARGGETVKSINDVFGDRGGGGVAAGDAGGVTRSIIS